MTSGEEGQGKSAKNARSLTRSRTISEYAWERKYTPLDAPDGSLIWNFSDLPPDKRGNHVWSWIEGDDGSTFAVPGYHVVNVMGYAVTEQPWADSELTVMGFGDSEAERAIEDIVAILWLDYETREWDRNKEWNSQTMTDVANVLTDRGFGPDPEAGWLEGDTE